MHILVTGGAGFIGSHVIPELLKRGDTIVNIDNVNDYYDVGLKRARLARFEGNIEHHEIDIADREAVADIFKKHTFDAVCHLAAQAGVRFSIENPFIYADSNYIGTLNIFEYAKQHAVPHIVFASTSSVYGKNEVMPFTEEDRVDTPMSIYAASKRACELLAHSYNHLFNMHITALRFFTVYGPWGRPDMSLALFTKAILADEPVNVFNNGDMARDFTYVDDIVSGIIGALRVPNGFQIYNLGNGSPVLLMDFIHAIEHSLEKKAVLNLMPMQQGDVPKTWASIEKAQKDFGYVPQTNVQEGVAQYVSWYRSYYGD